MSTRVTSAIASRKARENLIRLLLLPKDYRLVASAVTGTTIPVPSLRAHDTDRHSHSLRRPRKGDKSTTVNAASQQKRHSYSQLREMYLQKVHAMHPDKTAHQNDNKQKSKDGGGMMNNSSTKNDHLQFIELKHAWEEYHASVRIVQRRNGGDVSGAGRDKQSSHHDDIWEEEEDNFTMFGVGCSFADSPEERDRRNDIMEQACRGWFSSGSLSHHHGDNSRENHDRCLEGTLDRDTCGTSSGLHGDTVDTMHHSPLSSNGPHEIKLSDDDMFVCDDQTTEKEADCDCSKRKFLVQTDDRFRRKR